MPELYLSTILEATHAGTSGGSAPDLFRGIATDTRTLKPGTLFVALKGECFDGHDFVAEAFRRGAAGALVSREVAAPGPQLIVSDTLAALGALAASHRRSLPVQVVAITGSIGKTTTKEMVAAILSHGWPTARTPGNYNNEIGVPLALLELAPDHKAAVVELAMRGRGQIQYLAEMVQPQIGVITNIGVSHLELLGSREAIAETKAELLAALPSDGLAVLNADDDFFRFLSERSPARVVSFGLTGGADVQADRIATASDGRLRFLLRGWWGEQDLSLPAAGRHNAVNAAAAAAAAMAAGAAEEWIAAGLATFEAADMRSKVAKSPTGFTVIDDSYNAAPDSMRVALELLADLPGDRKWAVLGDMKELGPMAADWHREVGELAASIPLAGLITVGDLGRHIAAGARVHMSPSEVMEAADNAAAAALLKERLSSADVVLVKGSRVMKMEEIAKSLLASPEDTCHG
ncbi:MAG: UDP-N-acetylmuramoyl-tripeptide--D-alanyl-D-alanine ligase [Armatimonadota bacterium]|nr:MAG: UDP-N-acetylmuramoyl-tripeptide--D-alanyl-D-alanine ligase [Armatimonadota bacterium]